MALIGIVYGQQNKLEESIEWCSRCYEIQRRVMGEDHPRTNGMRNNLSVAYSLIGDYSLSSQLLMECFESYRRTLGPKHTSTLAIQANLGNAYRLLGRFAEAEAILLDCLSHEDHDKFTKPSSKRYLGLTYMSIGNYDRATKYYAEAFDMLEGVVGRTHDIYARSLMPMYLLQLKTASFESLEAIEAFESILRDVKWTQDLWKYTICHGCRREIQGVLCVCSDCPVYSFRYCASCTAEKKPESYFHRGLHRVQCLHAMLDLLHSARPLVLNFEFSADEEPISKSTPFQRFWSSQNF
ncbi:hypothetical protein AeRB84_003687 [Aphanomyces euteiches]|nr:hypothetical protein AeRB84_003687 [Aphanomyces euteiches]